MCFILGLSAVMESLLGCFLPDNALTKVIKNQFDHVDWAGFHFEDLIFPLFLFIAGVSIPFSLAKALDQRMSKTELYQKAFVRMLLLIGLGLLDKNAPFPFFDWPHIRLGSVLGRIGLAGFATVVLVLNVRSRRRLYLVGGILLAYYAGLMLIPVPGHGAGDLSFEGNLVGWFDRTFLPGRLLQGTYDELGILTQFPAVCLTLLGAFAGEILRDRTLADGKKFARLLLAGWSVWSWPSSGACTFRSRSACGAVPSFC